MYRGSGETALAIPTLKLKHQLLHAYSLTLRHPVTGEDGCFTAPSPPAMAQVIAKLKEIDG